MNPEFQISADLDSPDRLARKARKVCPEFMENQELRVPLVTDDIINMLNIVFKNIYTIYLTTLYPSKQVPLDSQVIKVIVEFQDWMVFPDPGAKKETLDHQDRQAHLALQDHLVMMEARENLDCRVKMDVLDYQASQD